MKILNLFLKMFIIGFLLFGVNLSPSLLMAAASTDVLIYDQPTSTPGTRTNIFRLNTSGVIWDEGGSGTVGTTTYPYATGYFTNLNAAGDLTVTDDLVVTDDVEINGISVYPADSQTIRSTTTVTPTATYETWTTTGGAITVTSVLVTSATTAGQMYVIRCATNGITIADEDTTTGANVQLQDNYLTLDLGDVLGLLWNGTDWVEMFYMDASMGLQTGGTLTVDGASTLTGVTSHGANLGLYSRTSTQIFATTPTAAGQILYDSTLKTVVIGTGTATHFDWVVSSGGRPSGYE